MSIPDLRSPLFALPSIRLDNPQHLLPGRSRIHCLATHAHIDFLSRVRHQQPLQQQMTHQNAHKHTAIARILLLRGVLQIEKSEWSPEELTKFMTGYLGLGLIGWIKRVIMEGNAVDDADEEK